MKNPELVDETSGRLLTDMGPVYYETDLEHLDHLIVEPFNAYSSLAMAIAAVLIWVVLLRKDFKNQPFLAFVFTPLLFIGGIGSTLFHANRSSQLFLLMDWLPILFLTVILSLHYWYKLVPRVGFIVVMTFLIIAARILPSLFLEGSAVINVSYFMSGVLILVPMAVFLYQNKFKYGKYVFYSIMILLMALAMRYLDDFDKLILPMGTHWLWHVLSAFGAWFLGLFIYKSSARLRVPPY